jgi:hypothetical protein
MEIPDHMDMDVFDAVLCGAATGQEPSGGLDNTLRESCDLQLQR